ncbi:hypothetical protein FQN57_004190 [Myotisia sp. PD_48]|nr:hypothetical protein FQN57_004190 [Myotisia sp. PD_48]
MSESSAEEIPSETEKSQSKWPLQKQDDGSFFIDGNGEMFKYVMEYLRRGVFPVAFDKATGHDHALYAKILEEARYFQCESLVKWLEHRSYETCVNKVVDISRGNVEDVQSAYDTYEQVQLLPFEKTTGAYICPRNILVHRSRSDCGRQCKNAMPETGPEYVPETTVTRWLIVATRFQVHPERMIDHGV